MTETSGRLECWKVNPGQQRSNMQIWNQRRHMRTGSHHDSRKVYLGHTPRHSSSLSKTPGQSTTSQIFIEKVSSPRRRRAGSKWQRRGRAFGPREMLKNGYLYSALNLGQYPASFRMIFQRFLFASFNLLNFQDFFSSVLIFWISRRRQRTLSQHVVDEVKRSFLVFGLCEEVCFKVEHVKK